MPQTSISAWLNKPKSILEAPQAAPTLPPAPTSNPASASAQNSPQCLLATLNHANANDVIMPDAPESDPEPPTDAPRKLTLQTPSFGLLPPLPGNVEFVPATAALMPSFRRLNALLLPIPYSPRFYDEILADPVVGNLTVLALWHPAPLPRDSPTTTSLGRDTAAPLPKQTQQNQAVLVGAIRCKLLSTSAAGTPKSASSAGSSNASGLMEPEAPPTLYLSTIVCLSTHRSHGIATHLLREVTRRAAREHGVASVTAHVWAANEEGLNWYARRGFEQVGREEGYYRRLKPGAAVLVRKMVGVADLLEERRESCA